MARVEKYTCDIDECGKDVPPHLLNMKIQVIFITEQTEGRTVNPYLEVKTLDLCPECFTKLISSKRYITASGAQGYNTYQL